MRRWTLVAALAAAVPAMPAAAQPKTSFVSEAEEFIKAVRERNGERATEMISARPTIVNSRNGEDETALVVAIKERDSLWTRFLLGKEANPNLAAKDGETPLIAASRVGFAEAVELLLALGAEVDKANRMGETALIVAVQQRREPIVRMLLAKGADPDKTDTAAGYSARDYAKRDTRTRDLLALIEASDKAAKKPDKANDLDSFKLE